MDGGVAEEGQEVVHVWEGDELEDRARLLRDVKCFLLLCLLSLVMTEVNAESDRGFHARFSYSRVNNAKRPVKIQSHLNHPRPEI